MSGLVLEPNDERLDIEPRGLESRLGLVQRMSQGQLRRRAFLHLNSSENWLYSRKFVNVTLPDEICNVRLFDQACLFPFEVTD